MTRICCACACFLSTAAAAAAQETARTPNFVIHATNREVAAQIGKQAEAARKAQALLWLGREMRPWKVPCELRIKFSFNVSEGATVTRFDGGGKVLTHDMTIHSPLERIPSVLAHELTHTVLAHAIGRPVPRWADEGAAVLAEDAIGIRQHDNIFGKMLEARGQVIPLRRLFTLKEYPDDMPRFYSEGLAVTRYLIERKDRATFLAFVKSADAKGWDEALRAHYDIRRIEDLEKAWLKEERRQIEPPPPASKSAGARP